MGARHLIVTGGTGYIGKRLIEAALARGGSVTLLGRRPSPAGTRHAPWQLGAPLPVDAIDPEIPLADQVIVHLAHDWQGGDDVNVDGTALLFDTARARGLASNVFISSQSARREARNRYGRTKWAAEQRLPADTSLRVGLVYGGPRAAMYGLLCRLARFPLLPMIAPQRRVQPIHIDEVVQGILAAADRRVPGTFALAGPEPVAFGLVLRELARAYGGRRLVIIPVPIRLALFACDLTARLPFVPTVDRERVLGLAGTETIESAADLAELGVQVSPCAGRLAAEVAGRRAALGEARALLRATGIKPGAALLRRYARAIPQGAIVRPRLLLRWREPIGGSSALATRLRLASRLAEASHEGEAMLASGTRASRGLGLLWAALAETVRMPSRLIATMVSR